MKAITISILIFAVHLFNNPSYAITRYETFRDTLTPLKSTKGWELYSWKRNNTWLFSLCKGTNRLKSAKEILKNKLTVNGVNNLKRLLKKLSAKESIYWISNEWMNRVNPSKHFTSFVLPPKSIVEEITSYCKSMGINLNLS